MKHVLWLILLLILPGCSPPTAKFIQDQHVDSITYIDIAPMVEVEDRLTKAFTEQVDWDIYDAEIITRGITTIKAEFEWLDYLSKLSGYLSYYDVVVANKKIEYWWSKVQGELDEISMAGEVDSDTSLIYYYVRRDINKALLKWKVSIQAAEASIDAKIHKYDVDQLKEAFDMLKPFIATVL